MRDKIAGLIGWILLFSILLMYLFGFGYAIALTLNWIPDKIISDYPEILSGAMSSIQTLLLANLGILLGIAISKPDSNIARALKLNSSTNEKREGNIITDPIKMKEVIQLWALIIFVFMLIISFFVWAYMNFNLGSDKVVSIIIESGKMLLGVFLAYLTAIMSKSDT